MRKIAAFIASLLMFALVSCEQMPAAPVAPDTASTTASATPVTDKPDRGLIGVSMPDKSIPRWKRNGQDIKKQLEANGYTVELMYADGPYSYISYQKDQISEMIAKGCKVLIIACFDGGTLDSVLAEAKAAGVTVIAYDHPLEYTANVDYYVTFDYFRFGALQGEYIEYALGLKNRKGPFNIEVFAGDRSDDNMMLFFEGGMSILRPYIENGQLVVKSGQTDWMVAYTDGWKSENAKARMDDLLAEYYADDKLDAVLGTADPISAGVIVSLEDAGYTDFPVITGMGCDKPNIMAMKSGKQSMSVFQDTRILAAKVVEMVDAVMTGREVPHNDAEHHSNGINFSSGGYNGVKQVPTFLCDPAVVTADNIQVILIDGGYYTEADLKE